ncbi:peptidoglycan editing factor PgeF [Aestuariibius insulae]|uniref:peptidoglycan editing factor PgeF n=1 Tax=Aestuariibius insulae TaxID=2058287 RepID=UPI00345EBD83
MTLDIITAPSLSPVRHGFFGRAGGASSGVFEGLNCGYGSSDQHEIVAINRSRAAAAMDRPASALTGVHQVHSADIVTVERPGQPMGKADGMVTSMRGIVLSVLAADCQPVLFADHEAGVIGATHAGWRGALSGALEATLDAMETIGAERGRIAAVIGPAISQRAYEVGPDFLETFLVEDESYGRFFAEGKGDRLHFDLPGFGMHKLREAGIGDADWTRHCTYSDPARFFSYRRSVHNKEADYGRLISTICL